MNDYCFAVTWSDDESAEPHVIAARDRDAAWATLCVKLGTEILERNGYDGTDWRPLAVELQFTRAAHDHRHKFCHDCGQRLGANPVRTEGPYYYHAECLSALREIERSES